MAYFSEAMPRPEPTMDDRPFWSGCAERRLTLQHCADCGEARHPPTPICPSCRSTSVEWREVPGTATVYTYTVVHYAAHPATEERLPYVVAAVTFEGVDGVRLVTNITDCDPDSIRIGMPVELWWDDIGDGMHLPRFTPSGSAG